MTVQTPSAEPQETDRIAAHRDYYRDALREMTEMAVNLARMVHDHSKAIQGIDLSEPFERFNRNIRRNIMLAERLAVPPKAQPSRDHVAARKKIIRDVEDAIQRQAPAGEQEKLRAELLERLEMPDFDGELDNRPVPEIVTEICRDLDIAGVGKKHPWKRRTPGDIAILNAVAARRNRAALPVATSSQTGTDPPPDRA